jgi:hypothetical protein
MVGKPANLWHFIPLHPGYILGDIWIRGSGSRKSSIQVDTNFGINK